ncbi:hypothetical protein [Hominenteromicrobium sp.]|uniref:hypothetical protein n=1 Tax=Hominenteromicrobium sp. TaxID=3073581 RepID=UPI00399B04F8
MIDMKKALQNIDDVIEKGPYKDTWASLSKLADAEVVSKGEVRHFHPLGRVQRAGV